MTRSGRAYTPERSRDFEAKVRAAAIDARRTAGLEDGEVFEGPVRISLHFVMAGGEIGPRTLREPATVVEIEELIGNAPSKQRGDLDNFIKSVLDGLSSPRTGGAETHVPVLIRDDRQVVEISATLHDP